MDLVFLSNRKQWASFVFLVARYDEDEHAAERFGCNGTGLGSSEHTTGKIRLELNSMTCV